MKKLAKIVCAVLAAAMTVVTVAGCGGSSSSFKAETINIGCSGPLTGGAAVYGTAVNNSAKMAVEEINAAGGLDGIKFAFEMMDDEHKAEKIANNYASLMDQGMQISLGTVTSAPCLAWTPLAVQDNLFCLTPSATNDDVPNGTNVFQMCFADAGQGVNAATQIKGLMDADSNLRLGIFYKSDDPYSNGIYEQFTGAFTGTITATASFTEQTNTDFSSQINTLKTCNFVFMPIYYQEASTFMLQATQAEAFSNDTVFYGCDGFDGIDGYLGNDLTTIPQEISFLSHFDSGATEGAAGTFVTKYTQKYGAATLNQFGAAAYDCVYTIFNALKAAKDGGATVNASLTPAQFTTILKAQLNGTGTTFNYSGVTGNNITWEANGTVAKTPLKFIVKAANTVA